MNAKKLFLGALGAVASLAISSNALAYYGETNAAEYQPGFYVGLQAGYAQTWWNNIDSITEDFPSFALSFEGAHGDYAGRGLVGYDFNEFFALELGLAYFKGGKTFADTVPVTVPLYQQEMRAYALDFVGKLSLPLDNGFRLFTKAGIQYFKTAHSPLFLDAPPFITDQENRKVAQVLFGVGASYAITPAFSADLSWSFYRGNSALGDKYLPDTDMYTFGLSYKFLCS